MERILGSFEKCLKLRLEMIQGLYKRNMEHLVVWRMREYKTQTKQPQTPKPQPHKNDGTFKGHRSPMKESLVFVDKTKTIEQQNNAVLDDSSKYKTNMQESLLE